jgi:hypothetical protein
MQPLNLSRCSSQRRRSGGGRSGNRARFGRRCPSPRIAVPLSRRGRRSRLAAIRQGMARGAPSQRRDAGTGDARCPCPSSRLATIRQALANAPAAPPFPRVAFTGGSRVVGRGQTSGTSASAWTRSGGVSQHSLADRRCALGCPSPGDATATPKRATGCA